MLVNWSSRLPEVTYNGKLWIMKIAQLIVGKINTEAACAVFGS